MEQLDLLGGPPPEPPLKPKRSKAAKPKTIDERCAEFDAAHPEVYAEIKRLALEALARRRRRIGIGLLAELARWNLETSARDGKGYKLNNDYRRSWTLRLIAEVPALASMFETRERRDA